MKKTVMVHIDGFPNHPFDALGQRTVLEAAETPHLDDFSQHGELGRLGIPDESRLFMGDLALLALLGYDTKKYYLGPGVFEGMSLEVSLDPHDVAFLCDLVTLRAEEGWGDGKKLGSSLLLDDVTAGGLDEEDARELLDAINDQLVSENIQFYKGYRLRHLMVWAGGNGKIRTWNPVDALSQPIDAFLPVGEGSEILRELMEASRAILWHHPINQERVAGGLKPLNCLWVWGAGKPLELPSLTEQWPITGVVVSPSGPYRGVGIASGLRAATMDEREGDDPDTFKRIAEMAAASAQKHNLVCLHFPCSSILGSEGEASSPTRYIDYVQCLDEHLLGTLQTFCAESADSQLLVVCTPNSNQHTEQGKPVVPYVLYNGPKTGQDHSGAVFHEREAMQHPLRNASIFFARLFGTA